MVAGATWCSRRSEKNPLPKTIRHVGRGPAARDGAGRRRSTFAPRSRRARAAGDGPALLACGAVERVLSGKFKVVPEERARHRGLRKGDRLGGDPPSSGRRASGTCPTGTDLFSQNPPVRDLNRPRRSAPPRPKPDEIWVIQINPLKRRQSEQRGGSARKNPRPAQRKDGRQPPSPIPSREENHIRKINHKLITRSGVTSRTREITQKLPLTVRVESRSTRTFRWRRSWTAARRSSTG